MGANFGVNTHFGTSQTTDTTYDESAHQTNVSLVEFHHPTAGFMGIVMVAIILILVLHHYCIKKKCCQRWGRADPDPYDEPTVRYIAAEDVELGTLTRPSRDKEGSEHRRYGRE